MIPKHRRGPWSSAEDQHLLHLVHSQGAHNWVRISQMIGSRSPKQCRERYHQNLKPSLNLDPITPEEGVMIERMVAEMGKRWAEIARRLNGRSDNAVKNWWNGGVNRRKRLETRRADSVATNRQSHVTVYCPPPSGAPGPYVGNQSHMHLYSQPMIPPYQGNAAAYGTVGSNEPRSLPYPAPAPLGTVPVGMHPQQRRLGEGPLPSPSAMSTASRAESCTGAAPSLVSDGGSFTSYSQSPNRSPTSTALPPLASIAGDHQRNAPQPPQAQQQLQSQNHQHHQDLRHQQQQYMQAHQMYQMDENAYRQAYKNHGYPAYAQSFAGQHQDWNDNQVLGSVVSPAGQHPLPIFRGSAGADARAGVPASPSRDNRMNLSSVIS